MLQEIPGYTVTAVDVAVKKVRQTAILACLLLTITTISSYLGVACQLREMCKLSA